MKWRSLEESEAGTDSRPLRDQLIERKQLIEKYVPEAERTVHERVVEELKQSRIEDRVLAAGTRAPQFELPDHNGNKVSSHKLSEAGPLLVVFFRGRWCPF